MSQPANTSTSVTALSLRDLIMVEWELSTRGVTNFLETCAGQSWPVAKRMRKTDKLYRERCRSRRGCAHRTRQCRHRGAVSCRDVLLPAGRCDSCLRYGSRAY